MYMGELALSRLLWSATTHIPLLKTRAENYPDALQHALLDFFGFEARFSCELAIKTIERDDPYYLTAHCIRAISAMNQVIFALNRQYIINEKKAIVRAMQCLIRPHMYQERVNAVMQTVGAAPDVACSTLSMLIDETTQLIPTQM
jgi:hypothetical protein